MPVLPFLRQRTPPDASTADQLAARRAAVASAREAGDEAGLCRLLGELGEQTRMLGDLGTARPLLEEALILADRLGDEKRALANRLRLATLLQHQDEHAAALVLFDDALARAERLGTYVDFARQHRGKCLAELGRWDDAVADFEAALALRRAAGDPGLLASTTEALAAARTARAAAVALAPPRGVPT